VLLLLNMEADGNWNSNDMTCHLKMNNVTHSWNTNSTARERSSALLTYNFAQSPVFACGWINLAQWLIRFCLSWVSTCSLSFLFALKSAAGYSRRISLYSGLRILNEVSAPLVTRLAAERYCYWRTNTLPI
jgi:hypothetical protein